METERAQKLIDLEFAKIVSTAAQPAAMRSALLGKVAAEVDHLTTRRAELAAELADGPARRAAADKTLTKLAGIIAAAEAEGRADLADVAAGRRAKQEAELADLDARAPLIGPKIAAIDAILGQLSDRQTELQSMEVEAAPALARPSPAPSPTTPAAPAVPAAGGGGEEDLDAEFAALLAEMGETESAAPTSMDDDDDDALLAGLPDLVEVGDGELPDGADPESEAPIDFSALDALTAGAAPAAAAKPNAAKGAPAKKTKQKAKANTSSKGPGDPGRSRRWLWIGLGTVVAGGGTVGALLAFGVL